MGRPGGWPHLVPVGQPVLTVVQGPGAAEGGGGERGARDSVAAAIRSWAGQWANLTDGLGCGQSDWRGGAWLGSKAMHATHSAALPALALA